MKVYIYGIATKETITGNSGFVTGTYLLRERIIQWAMEFK